MSQIPSNNNVISNPTRETVVVDVVLVIDVVVVVGVVVAVVVSVVVTVDD